MMEFLVDFKWFFNVPGVFITGGVVLIIIALIVFLISSSSAKKKTNIANAQDSVTSEPVKSDLNQVVSEPQTVPVEASNNVSANVTPVTVAPASLDIVVGTPLVDSQNIDTKVEPVIPTKKEVALDGIKSVEVQPTGANIEVQPVAPEPAIPTGVEAVPESINPVEVQPTSTNVELQPVMPEPVIPQVAQEENITPKEEPVENQEKNEVEEI